MYKSKFERLKSFSIISKLKLPSKRRLKKNISPYDSHFGDVM